MGNTLNTSKMPKMHLQSHTCTFINERLSDVKWDDHAYSKLALIHYYCLNKFLLSIIVTKIKLRNKISDSSKIQLKNLNYVYKQRYVAFSVTTNCHINFMLRALLLLLGNQRHSKCFMIDHVWCESPKWVQISPTRRSNQLKRALVRVAASALPAMMSR